MNCELVRELEAAFALDALDEADRHAVIAHLDGCGEHPKLAELRAVGILLAGVVNERTPPVGLRGRVLAATDPARPHGLRWGAWPWYAAAAVIVVACVAGAAWLTQAREGDHEAPYVREFTSDGGIAVRVEADFDAGVAHVGFAGLTGGADYQMWAIRGEDWLSMGAFTANSGGSWSGEFVFAIDRGDALCLTAGGPGQESGPFGEPLFIEPL